LQCGLLRLNFSLAIEVSRRSGLVWIVD